MTPLVDEQALAMGIRWCVDEGIRIVNVSYNITQASQGSFLARACQEADERGVVLVDAGRNGENGPVHPSAFPTVIGVRYRPDWQPGQISLLSEANRDLSAWGARRVAQPENAYRTMGGTSIAAGQVSAMVGRIHAIDDSLGLEEVFAFLMDVGVS